MSSNGQTHLKISPRAEVVGAHLFCYLGHNCFARTTATASALRARLAEPAETINWKRRRIKCEDQLTLMCIWHMTYDKARLFIGTTRNHTYMVISINLCNDVCLRSVTSWYNNGWVHKEEDTQIKHGEPRGTLPSEIAPETNRSRYLQIIRSPYTNQPEKDEKNTTPCGHQSDRHEESKPISEKQPGTYERREPTLSARQDAGSALPPNAPTGTTRRILGGIAALYQLTREGHNEHNSMRPPAR